MRAFYKHFGGRLWLAIGLVSVSGPVLADKLPLDWLNHMSAAVQSTSYEGTVIRIRDGNAEALKVVHTVKDGVIMEKVVAQEGNGLEIIRIGNEVHCILPDRKSVLIEEWDDQSTLFSTLPSSEIRRRHRSQRTHRRPRDHHVGDSPTRRLSLRTPNLA